MDRLSRAHDLLRLMTNAAYEVYEYQSTPRTYGSEEKLYMREAHFINAIGEGEGEIGKIAQKLSITNGAVSQLAARLEKKGYIIRQRDHVDSRYVICLLTPKGQKVLNCHSRMDQIYYREFEKMISRYTEEELDTCENFIGTIREYYKLSFDCFE